MKTNKKLIIALIVVAVAVWLLWKKGVFSKKAAGDTPTGPAAGTLDYYLANIAFTTAERNKILAKKAAAEASATTRERIQAEAAARGYTFDEMLILGVIWNLYHPNDAWIAGPDGREDYGWKLQQKVINL